MAEKRIIGRSVQKHDVEANWIKATNFTPMAGEIIIYDIDSTHSYERVKVGDGKTLVSALPFVDDNKVDKVSGKGLSTNDYTTTEKNKLAGIATGANKTVVDDIMSSTSTNPVQNKVVNAAIGAISALVGDTAVSTQISTAMAEKADIDHLHDVVYLNSKSAQLPSSHDWSAITYGDGTYVAVASGYNNQAAYSTDGVTWTQTTLPSYESWVDVAYGDGVFVAIAGDSSSVAAYSTDGITWTQRLMPNALNWTAVTYGNGMFLAVAHSSTIGALGFGGSSWQSTYLPDSLGWSDVTFDGSQYIVVTDDGNTIARSSNGFSWSTSSYSAMSEGITAVAAAQGQSKYVGLGTSMSEIFYYSTNGSYWTHAYVTSGDWRDVVYGNDKFVAVAYGTNMASYSVDGSSWINVTLPITANWTGITYGDGMFVAVAEGSTICAFSYDGITWMRSKTNLLDKNGNDVSNQIAALVNTINAPKTTTVTLSASGWSGSSNPWSQVVNINGVTANSKVDLQPTASQIVELQNADIMLMVENNAGVTTAYAIGGKPTSTYTMQALITEVIPV